MLMLSWFAESSTKGSGNSTNVIRSKKVVKKPAISLPNRAIETLMTTCKFFPNGRISFVTN